MNKVRRLRLSISMGALAGVLFALLISSGTLRAADVYVSPDVSAFSGEGTRDSPYGMIQAGIAAAWTNSEDTTVHLAVGIYSGQRIGGEGSSYPGGIGWDGVGMLYIENMDDTIGARGAGRIIVRGEGIYSTNTVISTDASTVPRAAGTYYNCGFIRGNPDKYNNVSFENLSLVFVFDLWGYGLMGQAGQTYANPVTPVVFNRCAIVFGANRGMVSGNDAPASAGVLKFRNTHILLGNADNRIMFQWNGTTVAAGFADGQNSTLIWNTGLSLIDPATLMYKQRTDKNGNLWDGATGYNVNGGFTNFNAASPYMAVFGTNGYEISDGDNTPSTLDGTEFGSHEWGAAPVTHTFVLENYGSSNLVLSGDPAIFVAGTGGTCFEVSRQPTLTTLTPGDSTSFEIQFKPWGAAEKNATIVITNNSINAAEFTVDLHGISVGLSGSVFRIE